MGSYSSVKVLDTLYSCCGKARWVQRKQVGKDNLHIGVLSAHLCNEDVVRGDDVVKKSLANEDIVGTEEHEDNIRRVAVEPARQVAVSYNVASLDPRVAFVVLVDIRATASTLLSSDKVKVCDTRSPELGLKVGPPASLE
jgi:hypothetical protein